MDKHTSLLLLTYLIGLALGVIGALIAILMSHHAPPLIQFNCVDASCGLLNHLFPMFHIVLIGGAVVALLTVLLSRGLYRLFTT